MLFSALTLILAPAPVIPLLAADSETGRQPPTGETQTEANTTTARRPRETRPESPATDAPPSFSPSERISSDQPVSFPADI